MALTSEHTNRKPLVIAAGWVGAVAIMVLPLVLNGRWWGFSLLGVALGIRMVEETFTTTARQRLWLRVAYVAVAAAGLVIGLLSTT